jgi:nucleotide-binding universal stress UspA family protein
MKKVLIALDFDPSAQKAAKQGVIIAQALGAKVFLIHVVSDSNVDSFAHVTITGFAGHAEQDEPVRNKLNDAKEKSSSFMKKMNKYLKENKIELLIEEGAVAEKILEIARKLPADLIVMGAQHTNQVEQTLIGASVENVLSHTSIPLLIIPTS